MRIPHPLATSPASDVEPRAPAPPQPALSTSTCPHLPGRRGGAHTACPNTSACPSPVAHVTHTRPPCPATVGLTTTLLHAPMPWEMKERGEGVSGSPPRIPASSRDPSSPAMLPSHRLQSSHSGGCPRGFTACLHIPGDTEKRGGRHQATLATLQRPPRSPAPIVRVRTSPRTPHLHLHLHRTTRTSAPDVL